ncbi:ADP-ribosylglycohydrolase [Fulvitalea axinellae]|uniref:ADP-ribosylglycohydrolase n=1 Tax=Fulvitalea axinellae TaxID=1182444 RepID=A0AAU9CB19_9BACT|nr:ADP-ribosylglycohydrolase [Fulvitalea axinellae]
MNKADQFEGCILGGAIGDAYGSGYEYLTKENESAYYLFGKPKTQEPKWQITDDTQLTLATVEAMTETAEISPETIADKFLSDFRKGKLSGLGASTLGAFRALDVGAHWSLAGRKGEYAAGNGPAMRIAPLAFLDEIDYSIVRDICFLTHHNDEAYVGAKCVVLAIREILNGNWNGKSCLVEKIIPQIPDTRVRDRLIRVKEMENLEAIGALGNDGYVVNSVPLAIAAANQTLAFGPEEIFSKLVSIGGDTDTNCSIAGQIMGTLIGKKAFPDNLIKKLERLAEYPRINRSVKRFIKSKKLVSRGLSLQSALQGLNLSFTFSTPYHDP